MTVLRNRPSRKGAAIVLAGSLLLMIVAASAGAATRPRATAGLTINPTSGPPGTSVSVVGSGFAPNETIKLFIHYDGTTRTKFLESVTASPTGGFSTTVTVPPDAPIGGSKIKAVGQTSRIVVRSRFTIT
jgi:hypothetical protein